MKISSSIRNLYNKQLELNAPLKERVRELFESRKHENWFYKGRIKQPESFAQKLATGRFRPDGLEDFFACTLVVENKKAIPSAIKLVESLCNIEYRRPKVNSETNKFPTEFSFDDLRLYVKLKPSDASPPKAGDNVLFEIQIKTFLQHAWTIATHDLVYKGDSVSWAKARLAFQIKAMLEHAEISIEQVECIAKSNDLATIDPKTKVWKDTLSWLQETWENEFLPQNIIGLAQNISDISQRLKINLTEIRNCVAKDTALGLGATALNLSPYEAIIKAIANHNLPVLTVFLNDKNPANKGKLFITPEMEIDSEISGISKDRLLSSHIPANP